MYRQEWTGDRGPEAAVQRFAEAEGIDLIGQHVEVETGKGADAFDRRPELGRALARARKAKCPVIVASSIAYPATCISFRG
jgi:hypothetical protein